MDTCPKCGKENCQCDETCDCTVVDENKYSGDDDNDE